MSGSSLPPSPEKLNFTARYGRQQLADHNELEEHFAWFMGFGMDATQSSGFAVEHIFSDGRDTISLHRASLKPDNTRTLMLVKQKLKLARHAVREILGEG
ncbi:hypothetical protein M422DRAFT_247620 [Sphaerobolus stellatus SS14]|nr:hypothetical protein M422DRAFT_247620 [Sphaerobolus stellatus SS14]